MYPFYRWYGAHVIIPLAKRTPFKEIDRAYYKYVIDPLIKRLYEDAIHSPNVEKVECVGGGSTLLYRFGPLAYPVLTVGDMNQYETLCKEKCPICRGAVYSPAFITGLMELYMFEVGNVVAHVHRYLRQMLEKARSSK